MKKRQKWPLILGCVVAVFALALLLTGYREPSYQGRKLSQWMNAFYNSLGGDPETPEYLEAAAAVRHMGTNALPHLLKWISSQPSRSKTREKLAAWMHKLPERVIPQFGHDWICEDARRVRIGRATVAFQILGTNAAPALPQLFRLANDPTDEERAIQATRATYGMGPEVIPALLRTIQNTNSLGRNRYAAMIGITGHGTNALPAVPILIHYLDAPEPLICCGAAEMLGRLQLEPATCVPALIRFAAKTNAGAQASGVKALGQFGTNAQPAVPVLHAALADKNEYIQRLATEALLKIAPEVLTNAPTP